jgi:hypothetical protein
MIESNISRSYGLTITERLLTSIPTLRNAPSFWISFNQERFNTEQLIINNRFVNYATNAYYLVKASSISPYNNRFVLYNFLNTKGGNALPTFSGTIQGTISISGINVTGTGTNFTTLGLGTTTSARGSLMYCDNKKYIIASVVSDTSMTLVYSEGDVTSKQAAIPLASNLVNIGTITGSGGTITGTNFNTFNIQVNTLIYTNGTSYIVSSVNSSTSITLTTNPTITSQTAYIFNPVTDTGITALPNTLYHIGFGVATQYKSVSGGFLASVGKFSFSINNNFFYFLQNTNTNTNDYTIINFGWANVNFNLFDLVVKQLDQYFTYTEIQQLYNGGQGIALDYLNRTLLATANLYFCIGDFLVSRNSLTTFTLNVNSNNGNSLVSNKSENGYYINDGWFQYTLNGKSLPINYYNNAKDRQPYRNGNGVITKTNYPEVSTLQNYIYDGIPYIYVSDVDNTGLSTVNYSGGNSLKELILIRVLNCLLNLNLYYSFCKNINISNSTVVNLNISFASKVDTTVTITSSSIQALYFGTNYTACTYGTITITSCTFLGTLIDPTLFDSYFNITYTVINITSFSGYFYINQRLYNSYLLKTFIVTPTDVNSGCLVDNVSRNLDFIFCSVLTNITITSWRCPVVFLPATSILTTIRLDGSTLKTAGFTFRTIAVPTLNSYSDDSKITLPTNNTITTLLITNTFATSINRVPTSVTLLDLRNNGSLTGTIDISGLANNITTSGGVYLSGSPFTGITLPSSTITIAIFSYSGTTSVTSLNTFSGAFPIGVNTNYSLANATLTGVGTFLSLGTVILSRTLDLSNIIGVDLTWLCGTIRNLYTNWANFDIGTVAKTLNMTNALITTKTPVAPTGYILNTSDGVLTVESNDASRITIIREIAYILINQTSSGVKKYNWSVTL